MRRRSITRMATSRARLAGLAAVAITAATVVPALAATAPHSVSLGGIVPSWVTTAPVLGAVDPLQQLNVEVVLNYRNAGELGSFVQSVSTPGSSDYRHFLTNAQFNARFSPAQADIAKV